jgi:hypothetical protein
MALDISKLDFPDTMDLRTAAIFLQLSGTRVRTLARDGELPASKNEAGHWQFSKAELEEYKAQPKPARGRRGDGKLWQIRIKYKDLEQVKKVLMEQFGIEVEPRYNYERQKEYRAKRKAQEKAQAAKK